MFESSTSSSSFGNVWRFQYSKTEENVATVARGDPGFSKGTYHGERVEREPITGYNIIALKCYNGGGLEAEPPVGSKGEAPLKL